MARELAPAVGRHLAVLGVQPDDDLAGEGAAGIVQEAGVLHCGGADDDVGETIVEIALDRVEVTDAAAQLDWNLVEIVLVGIVAHGTDDGLHGSLVLGLAGERAVQVDQVQAARALGEPVACHLGRVFGKYRGLVHIALFQAHAMTVFQIDGRYEQHGRVEVIGGGPLNG